MCLLFHIIITGGGKNDREKIDEVFMRVNDADEDVEHLLKDYFTFVELVNTCTLWKRCGMER